MPVRSGTEQCLRVRGVTTSVERRALLPVGVSPENCHRAYPSAPGLSAPASVAGKAFPTAFADDRQESTRPANRLCRAPLTDSRGTEGTCACVPGDTRRGRVLEVQIFGIRKSADTRKALRFFSERRIKTHFVDLIEKPASLGELRRFAQKFGVMLLVDKDSKRFAELGLRYAQLSDDRWLHKLSEEPLLLKIPLVRSVNQLAVGADEGTWKTWTEG